LLTACQAEAPVEPPQSQEEVLALMTRLAPLLNPLLTPDIYGGTYIDDENQLIILVTEESEALREALNEYLNEGEYVEIRLVDHSIKEMTEAIEVLNEIVRERLETFEADDESFNFYMQIASGIDVSSNRVDIWVIDFSEENIPLYRERLIDFPFVKFRERGE